MSLISVDSAILGYKKPVIGPLSFSVSVGERLGIWGPNGCGKSTFLRYFSGKAKLFSGTVAVKPTTSITYQPQYPIRPTELPLTGREYLNLMEADTNAIPKRMQPYLNKRIDKLSGGQFQILSTWANLSSKGELVLLDEPTNNLDPDAIELLTETILSMPHAHGLIVVSHEKSFIEKVATQMFVIQ